MPYFLEEVSNNIDIFKLISPAITAGILLVPPPKQKIAGDGRFIGETLTLSNDYEFLLGDDCTYDLAIDKYQWQRSENGYDWENIVGANQNEYTTTAADEGRMIRVLTDYAHGSVASEPITVRLVLTLNVNRDVDDQIKARLEGKENLPDPGQPIAWQWSRSEDNGQTWIVIEGAVSESYTPNLADAGKKLKIEASYQGPGNNPETISKELAVNDLNLSVAIKDSFDETLEEVSGTKQVNVGQELKVVPTVNGNKDNITYQWQKRPLGENQVWEDIDGATSGTYIPALSDEHADIRVAVNYTDHTDNVSQYIYANEVNVRFMDLKFTVTDSSPYATAVSSPYAIEYRVWERLEILVTVNWEQPNSVVLGRITYEWKKLPDNTIFSGKVYFPRDAGTIEVKAIYTEDNLTRSYSTQITVTAAT